MSAQEIIEQIKALPEEERQIVKDYLEQAETVKRPAAGEVRYVDEKTFRVAMEKVFATHDELFRRLAQ